jgi:hypothetical protein
MLLSSKPLSLWRFATAGLDPVAPLFLGHVARHVGRAQGCLQRGRALGNVHEANAHGGHEWPAFPDEMQVLYGLAQTFGNFLRCLWRAVFQQDAKLIAAQARQCVVFPQPRLQQRANMPQQLVTRGVATGIVDQLELVQVKKHQGVAANLARQVMQGLFESVFEFAAVRQAGQGIVGGLPGKVGDVLAFLGHVVQYQHGTADLARVADRCADQCDRHRTAVQPLDQLGMFTAAAKPPAEDVLDQGQSFGLGVVIEQIE